MEKDNENNQKRRRQIRSGGLLKRCMRFLGRCVLALGLFAAVIFISMAVLQKDVNISWEDMKQLLGKVDQYTARVVNLAPNQTVTFHALNMKDTSRSAGKDTSEISASLSQQIPAENADSLPAASTEEPYRAFLAGKAPEGAYFNMQLTRSTASAAFLATLLKVRTAPYIALKIKYWQEYLQHAQDSTFRSLAVSQLAEAITAAADSSDEVLQLADAVAFYQQNARVLRLLMGDSLFQTTLDHLKERLHAARTR